MTFQSIIFYVFAAVLIVSALREHVGAAIDLDADDNTFRDHWPMQADMPLEIMEAFAREGWVSAGAFWGYDAMHFEAVRRG